MFDRLPPELLDIILDHFHDDTAALKACSMLSRTSLLACQPRIFSIITLEYIVDNSEDGPISSHCRFLDILTSSTHLTPLVRELRFTLPRSLKALSGKETLAQHAVPAEILMALPQLQTLVVRTQPGYLIWSRLSAELTMALRRVVQLPTLRHLDLSATWQFPPSFFSCFTNNLQVLRFSEICLPNPIHEPASLETTGVPNQPSGAHPGKEGSHSLSILSSMTSQNLDALFVRPGCTLDISRLRSLTLASFDDKSILQRILQTCGPSLSSLRMHMQHTGILALLSKL
jgi:hypothetical protein